MNLFLCTFLLIPSVFSSDKEQFLKFSPKLPDSARQIYFQSPGAVSPIEVDATWPHQVRIRIVDFLNGDPELKIHCAVAPLDSSYELTYAALCFKPSLTHQQQCIDPKDQLPNFGAVSFDSVGSRSEGYTFAAQLPVGKYLLDGYYFCKFRNIRGELMSNMVEIQDAYYYHKKWVERSIDTGPQILPKLSAVDLPLRLECGQPSLTELKLPSWTDPSFPSPFRWSFCDMSSSSEFTGYNCMTKMRSVRVSDYFEHIVFPNGTLLLLSRTPATWKNMGLLCVSNARPSTIFSVFFGGSKQDPKPLQYDSSVPYPANHPLVPMSPTFQNLKLRKGPNDVTKLTAVYQANMNNIQYEWTKNGDRLPFDFPQPTPFVLRLPRIIETNHSGVYSLHVTDQRSSLRFQYSIEVVGPPDVLTSPPPVLFVMEGNNATFKCALSNFKSKHLRINGQSLLYGSEQSQLVEQFPYLKDVKFHPLYVTQDTQMEYKASNLKFPTRTTSYGPTHIASIVAANDYGSVTVSTLVVVLPRPRILDSPASHVCGPPCLNSAEHTFQCKIDMTPYRRTHVIQTWDFDGVDVATSTSQGDPLSEYIRTDGTTLRLLKVPDESAVKMFAKSVATCRLRIYSKAVTHSPGSDGAAFPNAESLIYDSRDDAELTPLLSAEINLELDTTVKPAAASMSWIAAVIIAVLILIVIGTLISCLVVRRRGETYLLDKEERALGNDPEKELRENEAFRTYERAEEPLLRGSRCSLNEDSAEIGSDADGELDDYNLDPGKFNEEGSFIDQYATETRYKGASRQPPTLPRSHDPQL